MASNPLVIYPLDPTGSSPNNLIVGDIETVIPNENTAVKPIYGFYYAGSMIIKDNNTNQTLVRGEDYLCVELSGEFTGKYGQEICGMVLFLGTNGTTQISMSYQCLGGHGQFLPNNISELYQNITSSPQLLEWNNILNKPLQYTPNNHVNMLEDIYGFEPIVYALERIRGLLQIGNTQSYQNLMAWVQDKVNAIQAPIVETRKTAFNYIDFIGEANADIQGVVYSSSITNNINFYKMPNGFRVYWQLISPYSNNYYSPGQGIVNVNVMQPVQINNSSPGYVLAHTDLYLSIFDYYTNSGSTMLSWYTFNQPSTDLIDRTNFRFMQPANTVQGKLSNYFNSSRRINGETVELLSISLYGLLFQYKYYQPQTLIYVPTQPTILGRKIASANGINLKRLPSPSDGYTSLSTSNIINIISRTFSRRYNNASIYILSGLLKGDIYNRPKTIERIITDNTKPSRIYFTVNGWRLNKLSNPLYNLLSVTEIETCIGSNKSPLRNLINYVPGTIRIDSYKVLEYGRPVDISYLSSQVKIPERKLNQNSHLNLSDIADPIYGSSSLSVTTLLISEKSSSTRTLNN